MTVVHDNDIELASGLYLDVAEPQPEMITLHDVASGLSKMCRFGGQCTRFYSVAEHAIFVADRLLAQGYGPSVQLAGLHHDDHEGLGLCDLPRPVKRLVRGYDELSAVIQVAIEESLGLPQVVREVPYDIIKRADNWALMQEAGQLLPSGGVNWIGFGEQWDGVTRPLGLSIEDAYESWLYAHNTLMDELR